MIPDSVTEAHVELKSKTHDYPSHLLRVRPGATLAKDMETPFHFDRRAALAVVLLTGLTLVVFAPVVSFQFINVDDSVYVTGNDHVQQGLTWPNAAWALTSLEAANWHPVTWLSHMLDVTLFGLNPGGHHATSLLLHTLNVIVLFLCRRCGRWRRTS